MLSFSSPHFVPTRFWLPGCHMPRRPRDHYRSKVVHVSSRGNNRRDIFVDDADRLRFVNALASAVRAHRWRLHAWTLMTNHYHLLVEPPVGTLSAGMKKLNGTYANYFNRRHERSGHLFGERFNSTPILSESHQLRVIRYVVLNPVEAGMVSDVSKWLWSSYRATAGLSPVPNWLDIEWTLGQMCGDSTTDARERYRQFVDNTETLDIAWQAVPFGASVVQTLPAQLTLCQFADSDEVVAAVLDEFDETHRSIAERSHRPGRKVLAWLLRTEAGLSSKWIARILGCSVSGANGLVRAGSRMEQDRADIAARIRTVTSKLKSGDR